MDIGILVERMQPEDIGQVTELINSIVPWEFDCGEAGKAYRSMCSRGDSAVFVAKIRDTVVGTVTAICCESLAAKFLAVEDVVVAPHMRGQGIGTGLMQAVDAFARERNCGYAVVVSSGHRTRAHRFYEKCGFDGTVRGFRKGYVND